MRLLILGGSWSLGKMIAARSIASGFEVAVCNSGRKPAPHPDARLIAADRANPADLARLVAEGPWDTVLDISGKEPAVVSATAGALRGAAARYVAMSSVYVYRDWPGAPVGEGSPVFEEEEGHPAEPPGAGRTPARYGRMKASCERACLSAFGAERVAVLRLGTVIGQVQDRDPMQWWLDRVRRGGDTLVPDPDRALQPIDVRDLAEFTFRLINERTAGTFNVVPAPTGRTFADLIAACRAVIGDGAQERCNPVAVSERWLLEQGVREVSDVPLWHAGAGGNVVGHHAAARAGLTCRDFADTAAFVWGWLENDARPPEQQRFRTIGLPWEREQELIAEWRARPG